ncbi:MAG: beta-lactamase family protein [Sandaracinaceae bacterium]|nr:beta-lactamase family protein [Sandaracinaceae bacterium]
MRILPRRRWSRPKQRSPGLCAIAFDAGGERRVLEQGFADLSTQEPFTERTRSRWFSVTKLLTATAILQLVERGLLSLRDRVADRLAFFRPEPLHPAVTVEHLLAHTAGLADPSAIGWLHRPGARVRSPGVLTRETFDRYRKLQSVPGERARYTNLGYLVLGELVSEVSGTPFDEFVNENILSHLALADTGWALEPCALGHERVASTRTLAMGLVFAGRARVAYAKDGWVGLRPFALEGQAYGGLLGSTRDLARVGRMFLRGGELDGRRVLDAELARRMRVGRSPSFALGWWCLGGGWLGHTGEAGGFRAELRIHPERGVGAAVLANAGRAPVERIAVETIEAASR